MQVGIENIWAAIQERVQILVQGFQAIPQLELLTNTSPERRSGIITIRPTHKTSEGLFEYLKTNKVFWNPIMNPSVSGICFSIILSDTYFVLLSLL